MTVDFEALRVAAAAASRAMARPLLAVPRGGGCSGRRRTPRHRLQRRERRLQGGALCAECGLISDLVLGGGGRLLAFTCVNGLGEVITPCGRCRQLLWEHGGPELLVETPAGVVRMDALLPFAFGPENLDAARD